MNRVVLEGRTTRQRQVLVECLARWMRSEPDAGDAEWRRELWRLGVDDRREADGLIREARLVE